MTTYRHTYSTHNAKCRISLSLYVVRMLLILHSFDDDDDEHKLRIKAKSSQVKSNVTRRTLPPVRLWPFPDVHRVKYIDPLDHQL